MGYRDDFYISENIIGYTGSLGDRPTVYFQHGNEFGRITQHHPNPGNVGRNVVRKQDDYDIANYINRGAIRAEEKWDGKTRHKSRNPFFGKKVTNFERSRLAIAIVRFPNLKPKHDI
jgi:hypothetical protein